MDKIKITNRQFFSLTACSTVGGTVLVVSTPLAGIAKQDAWISALLTPSIGIVLIWIYGYLGSKFPNMTFFAIIRSIYGRWLGTVIVVGYEALFLILAARLPWYVGNFITSEVMPETPLYIINLLYIIAIVIASLYGLESFARASEIFILISSILFFSAMLFVLPNAKFENLRPILEGGFVPIIKGIVLISSFYTFALSIVVILYPLNAINVLDARNWMCKGYLWGGLIVFTSIIMAILVLGNKMVSLAQRPTYLLAKEINIGTVLTRFEFVIGYVWILTQYLLGLLAFYGSITGFKELLTLKDPKPIILPFSLIVYIMSLVVAPDAIYETNWAQLVWGPYSLTYWFILPIISFLVFLIKKQVFKAGAKNK